MRKFRIFTLREIVRATSIELCTLEPSGYLAYNTSSPESTPLFTDVIRSALVSVEELDSIEDTPLRFALLRGENKNPRMLLVLG